ncbi:glucosylceramidase [Cytobacillus oceanisediminis]|uniref:Glucosylceramidase n=2 Tax=Niallia TaxID=2837506 RepID=A0A941GGB1_NIACI|nr:MULTISPECIES: glycoside hydrolase family 30 beta sandwich domain-containing protein [Bacillaceae]MBQ6447521.1 glucosylceramidase [Bacillus sp. (in: firmicutes)]MDU1846567.1 glycoside hydrolase family 30 beta sandwich domain-containing protein [Niallia nealsonii]MBZ9533203.1 glucosylceramidase [Cytobacillus oceanisediminis]MCB5237365.1 glucosylceramidase [Niallia circulans]NMO79389.1 glucosylceramidase [Niallia alba]
MKINLSTTTYEENKPVTNDTIAEFTKDNNVEMKVVNIYPEIEYQTFDGFGGAITEAAGYTYSKMSESSQQKLVDAYFGENGNRYNLIRTHIDSCDFSVGQYEAMSNPEDKEFQSFSLARDEEYILPLLKKVTEVSAKPFDLMLSPWSPPSFMKTNEERVKGGKLKPEFRQFWADYICHYIKEYQLKGFPVKMLTIQNEPNARQSWDSCLYTDIEEKEFLRDYLYPTLQKNNLSEIEVLIWDHNKERMYERAAAIIDNQTDNMIAGVAFHWYTGDHFDAIGLVREKFPNKKLIFTEGCVEYSRFNTAGQLQKAQMYAHDMIGNINAGMNAFIDWNIILDRQGGPNHVGNYCDAPIMCDTENDQMMKNLSYTYIGHFSRYIEPGAKRIAATKYTDKLELVAMKNPNNQIVLVLLNRFEEDLPVALRMNGEVSQFSIAANSIVTAILA